MKKVFNTLSIIFAIILIFWFTQINYSDLSFKQNLSPYLGIISMTLMIIAMQMARRGTKK